MCERKWIKHFEHETCAVPGSVWRFGPLRPFEQCSKPSWRLLLHRLNLKDNSTKDKLCIPKAREGFCESTGHWMPTNFWPLHMCERKLIVSMSGLNMWTRSVAMQLICASGFLRAWNGNSLMDKWSLGSWRIFEINHVWQWNGRKPQRLGEGSPFVWVLCTTQSATNVPTWTQLTLRLMALAGAGAGDSWQSDPSDTSWKHGKACWRESRLWTCHESMQPLWLLPSCQGRRSLFHGFRPGLNAFSAGRRAQPLFGEPQTQQKSGCERCAKVKCFPFPKANPLHRLSRKKDFAKALWPSMAACGTVRISFLVQIQEMMFSQWSGYLNIFTPQIMKTRPFW